VWWRGLRPFISANLSKRARVAQLGAASEWPTTRPGLAGALDATCMRRRGPSRLLLGHILRDGLAFTSKLAAPEERRRGEVDKQRRRCIIEHFTQP
jgi:hypothetical protein